VIGAIVYQALASSTAVSALVGTRIYPEIAPDEADLPLIVYTVRAQDEVAGNAPMTRCTVTANCYAATDVEAESVGAAVRAVLDGFDGNGTGVQVRQLSLSDYSEVRDPEMALWGRLASFTGWIVKG
jgi:hypothetical protein